MQYYGDGTLIMFGSALDAVKCARDIQLELTKQPQVPFRIGIHIGDVVYDDEGIYGDAVNVASWIQSVVLAGSVMISDNVFSEIKDHPGVRVESCGEHKQKNVSMPVNLYSLVYETLPKSGEELFEGLTGNDSSDAGLGSLKRGVSDMFRTSYRNHIELSAIADNKSNIMISINGIIISIMIASLPAQITSNSSLALPAAVLLITCLLSLIYSVLAARPRVSKKK